MPSSLPYLAAKAAAAITRDLVKAKKLEMLARLRYAESSLCSENAQIARRVTLETNQQVHNWQSIWPLIYGEYYRAQ